MAEHLPLFAAPPTTPRHWDWFADFCRYEQMSGGPDPHMKMMAALCAHAPPAERVWCGGCYVGFYNAAGATAFWRAWPYARYVAEASQLQAWLHAHWDQLLLHRHRRTVNSPLRLAAYFHAYAASMPIWMREPAADYEAAWRQALSIKHIGRYMGIKLLEFYRLAGVTPVAIPDIRPADAWSPRRGLTYLWPQHTNLLTKGGNEPAALATINGVVESTARRLLDDYDVRLTNFEIEVFLCEYRQVYERRKQYPGKPLDSELGFARDLAAHWGPRYLQELMDVRQRLSPAWALGETQGWGAVRPELGATLAEYGYMWTDYLYDYHATASGGDWAAPVSRAPA